MEKRGILFSLDAVGMVVLEEDDELDELDVA